MAGGRVGALKASPWECGKGWGFVSDPPRTRTENLLIKSQLLCQIELAGRCGGGCCLVPFGGRFILALGVRLRQGYLAGRALSGCGSMTTLGGASEGTGDGLAASVPTRAAALARHLQHKRIAAGGFGVVSCSFDCVISRLQARGYGN